jgi:hypothetical protein
VSERDGARVAQIEAMLGHPVRRDALDGFAYAPMDRGPVRRGGRARSGGRGGHRASSGGGGRAPGKSRGRRRARGGKPPASSA